MAIERNVPIGYYVYTIRVDGVVRYIGKGKGLRLYFHMKEVRNRLNRDYRLQNIKSRLQQNLTKAVLSGAKVIEQVLVDNLTQTAAYKLEYDKLREYVFAGQRDQLWNVIPASIQTPQELHPGSSRLSRLGTLRDRTTGHTRLESLQGAPRTKLAVPDADRRRPARLDERLVAIPAPNRHRGDAQFALNVRVRHKFIVLGSSIRGHGKVAPLAISEPRK